jgi:hypothetical protein
MSTQTFIPASLREAAQNLRAGWQRSPTRLSRAAFVRVWSSIAYLFPGLHPDAFDDPDSGWPNVLKCFASEAWRRAEAGELVDEELYPSDAQWAGLYDRMTVHTPDETKRRKKLSSAAA